MNKNTLSAVAFTLFQHFHIPSSGESVAPHSNLWLFNYPSDDVAAGFCSRAGSGSDTKLTWFGLEEDNLVPCILKFFYSPVFMHMLLCWNS